MLVTTWIFQLLNINVHHPSSNVRSDDHLVLKNNSNNNKRSNLRARNRGDDTDFSSQKSLSALNLCLAPKTSSKKERNRNQKDTHLAYNYNFANSWKIQFLIQFLSFSKNSHLCFKIINFKLSNSELSARSISTKI